MDAAAGDRAHRLSGRPRRCLDRVVVRAAKVGDERRLREAEALTRRLGGQWFRFNVAELRIAQRVEDDRPPVAIDARLDSRHGGGRERAFLRADALAADRPVDRDRGRHDVWESLLAAARADIDVLRAVADMRGET